MRYLVVTRGLPGSGKSTVLEEAGLTPYTLAADDYRERLGGIVLNEAGRWQIDQTVNPWKPLMSDLATRLEQGQFTVVDSTAARPRHSLFPRKSGSVRSKNARNGFEVLLCGQGKNKQLTRRLIGRTWDFESQNPGSNPGG